MLDDSVVPVHLEPSALTQSASCAFIAEHVGELFSCPDVLHGPGGPWGWGGKVIYVSSYPLAESVMFNSLQNADLMSQILYFYRFLCSLFVFNIFIFCGLFRF